MLTAYFKELRFPSRNNTYFLDLTNKINDAIGQTKVKNGLAVIISKHTTLGLLVNEIAEPNLLEDIIDYSLTSVPEDKKSTKVSKDYKYPTAKYKHRCQDNPYCREIDEDYNAAEHIRSISFSQSNISLPIKNGTLVLGAYQQVAAFEFDGRDGKGKNPIRDRRIQIWIYPFEKVKELK